ncbi:MAG: D-alanine--D-alanine ligase [Planctomycetota bacterium]|nr:D-alanine--D-alanine ligase [Planctomycetota bacterium]
MQTVLVLAGGPDAERPVSLMSGRAVAEALASSGRFTVNYVEIDRPTGKELSSLDGDVVWPVLHGPFGEGGPMQDLLEAGGRPYVGCGPRAARLAMDKVASKSVAMQAGLNVHPTCVLKAGDEGLPLPLPVVVKPVFEGSTIGLFICRSEEEWRRAHAEAARSGKAYMVEPYVPGKELTLGVLDRGTPGGGANMRALPWIHIAPADGLYDYEAKYTREDTVYRIDPELPQVVREQTARQVEVLARLMGIRHLCRADFILDDEDRAWFLEVNTMPGFTGHSLVPKAAGAMGLDMPSLCAHIVDRALLTPRP